MAIKNMAASVLTRLKNQSKEEGIPFQMVLQLFAQEEFLRKLSLSQYADNLILKGGMFIYTLTEFDSRPTRDIDFLIKNLHGSLENIEHIMRDICNISTGNDFITIEVLGTETISVDKKYPGVKTSFMGSIGKVRIPFSIDVGIDDVIVPDPIKRMIITRLPDDVFAEIEDFKNSDVLNTHWKAFDPVKESGLLFDDALDRLIAFLEPIYQNILRETDFDKRWSCENEMWM